MLELSDIRKIYKVGPIYKEVLRGLFLDLYKGEAMSIFGAPKSGKSALMRIMGCLEKPTSGSIEFENEEIGGFDESTLCSLRNFIFGYIFENLPLIDRLSVMENVILPLKIRAIPAKEAHEKAMESLRNTGAVEFAKSRPGTLTDVMRFRASMARAVVGEPDIILIDDPKVGEDSDAGQEMLDLVFMANEEGGMAVVLTTDNQRTASRFTRRTELKDGLIDGRKRAVSMEVAGAG